jgi:hypothetical protein
MDNCPDTLKSYGFPRLPVDWDTLPEAGDAFPRETLLKEPGGAFPLVALLLVWGGACPEPGVDGHSKICRSQMVTPFWVLAGSVEGLRWAKMHPYLHRLVLW